MILETESFSGTCAGIGGGSVEFNTSLMDRPSGLVSVLGDGAGDGVAATFAFSVSLDTGLSG